MYCDKCGKDLVEKDDDCSFGHYFSGYGYALEYCAECCPIEFDGIICECEHPIKIDK